MQVLREGCVSGFQFRVHRAFLRLVGAPGRETMPTPRKGSKKVVSSVQEQEGCVPLGPSTCPPEAALGESGWAGSVLSRPGGRGRPLPSGV